MRRRCYGVCCGRVGETLPLAGLGRAAERGNSLAHRVGVCKRGFNAPCFEMIVTLVCLSFNPAREDATFDVTPAIVSRGRAVAGDASYLLLTESLLLVQVIRARTGSCSMT